MAVVVKRRREREGVVLVGVKIPARTVECLDAAAAREDRTRSRHASPAPLPCGESATPDVFMPIEP